MGNSSSHTHFSAQYVAGKHIATGSFAIVKKCKRKADNQQFAVKIVKKADLTPKELDAIKDEIAILKLLTKQSYPHAVHLERVFEDEKAIIMVMELCHERNLLDVIYASRNRRLTEKTCAQITHKIAKSLQYFHTNHIVHRDLKPENILFSKKKKVKIADFGSAKYIKMDRRKEGAQRESTLRMLRMKTMCGSPYYIAPEIICNESKYYSYKVDLWSLGVILYLMLCGTPPFSARKGINELYKNILNGNYSFSGSIWDGISDDAKDLVEQLLCSDVAQRVSVDGVLRHKWIQKYNK